MKNNKIKTVLFSLVIMMSLSSYLFLNSLSIPIPTSDINIEEVGLNDLTKQNEVTLPDVQIIEKGVEMMKRVLPISQ